VSACAWLPVEALGSGLCVDLAGQDVLSGVCVAPGPKNMAYVSGDGEDGVLLCGVCCQG